MQSLCEAWRENAVSHVALHVSSVGDCDLRFSADLDTAVEPDLPDERLHSSQLGFDNQLCHSHHVPAGFGKAFFSSRSVQSWQVSPADLLPHVP